MATVRTWFLETRPAFLLLVPVCILVGIATVRYRDDRVRRGNRGIDM